MKSLPLVLLLLAANAWSATTTFPMQLDAVGAFQERIVNVQSMMQYTTAEQCSSVLSGAVSCVDIHVLLNTTAYGGDIVGLYLGLDDRVTGIAAAIAAQDANVTLTALTGPNPFSDMSPYAVYFDFGFATGSPGASDILRDITLRVAATNTNLLITDFTAIGVRVHSVGYLGSTEQSGKYFGTFNWQQGEDVPEPSTFVLAGGALLGLSLLRRRK